ncbi:PIN domain-containing protein [Halomonas garicola]|uniref:PIN domain-containing protein n=1 Tax=Halomonas garicola TaxID=1690008 RepID=UPI00289A18BD|nr:PIN domain-containing protein [Halomonas garicola]
MLLLISDANVIIDLDAGNILPTLFRLPYRFAMPDILYFDEIEEGSPGLTDLGLKILTVESKYVEYASELGIMYGDEPGFYDRLALALAKQEACPLVTGDLRLRAVASKEGAEIRGTLWVLTEMIECGFLTKEETRGAVERMKNKKRRLPWDDVEKHIDKATYSAK